MDESRPGLGIAVNNDNNSGGATWVSNNPYKVSRNKPANWMFLHINNNASTLTPYGPTAALEFISERADTISAIDKGVVKVARCSPESYGISCVRSPRVPLGVHGRDKNVLKCVRISSPAAYTTVVSRGFLMISKKAAQLKLARDKTLRTVEQEMTLYFQFY